MSRTSIDLEEASRTDKVRPMSLRAWAVAPLVLCTACAVPPGPRPVLIQRMQQAQLIPALRIQLVGDVAQPGPMPSRIGKTDLDQARALLERARTELQPGQWALLDQKLAQAERAWERYDALVRPTGKAAEVPRAAGALPAAGILGARTLTAAEAGAVSLGALFAVLAALWPATVADGTLPAWHRAQQEFATKLEAVVKAAEQVKVQLEEGKRRPPRPPPRPPRRRPECEPVPMFPHLGGDAIHNTCADLFPPNRFPKHDVLVNGVRYDALEVGADVLWEIKTMRLEIYNEFVQEIELSKEVHKMRSQYEAAQQCGYEFAIGVSSKAHQDALLDQLNALPIRVVLNGC